MQRCRPLRFHDPSEVLHTNILVSCMHETAAHERAMRFKLKRIQNDMPQATFRTSSARTDCMQLGPHTIMQSYKAGYA